MAKYAIRTENLTKEFNIYKNNLQMLKGTLFNRHNGITRTALDNINLEIKKGEKVALLGNVAAGRTTLLRILSGIMYPTSGKVKINGKVTSIFDFRMGLDMELTGRENIYTKASIIGIPKKDIKAKEKEIIEFAELEDVIDLPMKSYKAGYAVRLGFAVYFAFKPEILLLDDQIAVKDKRFRDKCINTIKEMMNDDESTIIIVSNLYPTIKALCDRGIVLDEGQLKFDGTTEEAYQYFKKNLKKKLKVDNSDRDIDRDDDDDEDDYDDF